MNFSCSACVCKNTHQKTHHAFRVSVMHKVVLTRGQNFTVDGLVGREKPHPFKTRDQREKKILMVRLFAKIMHQSMTESFHASCCLFLFHSRCFGPKCGGCGEPIHYQDFVRKARDKVYHLRCFTCTMCSKQLSTGEVLYLQPGDDSLVCKDDYLRTHQGTAIKKFIEKTVALLFPELFPHYFHLNQSSFKVFCL